MPLAIALIAFVAIVLGTRRGSAAHAQSGPPLTPRPSPSPMYARVPSVAEAIRRMWQEATKNGSAPPPAALEILLSQAALESGINPANPKGGLGAHQCTRAESQDGPKVNYFTCYQSTDTSPTAQSGANVTYNVGFRQYQDAPGPGGTLRPAADWAAYDFLRSIAHDRPAAFARALTGDVDGYAAALYDSHYYQGYGTDRAERVAGYAKSIRAHLPAVAAALGHDRVFAT